MESKYKWPIWLKCQCKLVEGTVCKLGPEGIILCPICGLPIKNQLEMESKDGTND